MTYPNCQREKGRERREKSTLPSEGQKLLIPGVSAVSRSVGHLGVETRAECPNMPCSWLCATLPPSRLTALGVALVRVRSSNYGQKTRTGRFTGWQVI